MRTIKEDKSKPLAMDEVITLRKHYTARGINNYFKRHYPVIAKEVRGESYKILYYPYLGLYDYALYLGLMTANMCKKYKCPVGPKEPPMGSVWTGFTWHEVYNRIDLVKNGSISPYEDKLKEYLIQNLNHTTSMRGFDGTEFKYIDGKIMEVHTC